MSRFEVDGTLDEVQSRLSRLKEQDSQDDRRRLTFTVGGLLVVMALAIPACPYIGGPRMARELPGLSETLVVTAFILSLAAYFGGLFWLTRRDLDGELIGRAERLIETLRPISGAAPAAKLSADFSALQRADLLVDTIDEGINTGMTASVKVDTFRQNWMELALPMSSGPRLEIFATRGLIVTTRSQGKSVSTEHESKDQLVLRVIPEGEQGAQEVIALHHGLSAQPHIEMQSADINEGALEISLAEAPRSSVGASPVKFWLEWFVDQVKYPRSSGLQE